MTRAEIQENIDRNRNEIDKFLGVDLPLDIIYFNVRRLSQSNERLIEKLRLTSPLNEIKRITPQSK